MSISSSFFFILKKSRLICVHEKNYFKEYLRNYSTSYIHLKVGFIMIFIHKQ